MDLQMLQMCVVGEMFNVNVINGNSPQISERIIIKQMK